MHSDSSRYARNTDPVTSRLAARTITTVISEKHLRILQVLIDLDVATDDQIATEAVNRGIVQRHEQARRLVRTIRDGSDYIRPALDDNLVQRTLVNDSGSPALAWELSLHGISIVLSPSTRTLK